tara:strand:+ start:854 stop:1252 length:399 start_codon:yes stop_codon:yes gene_type:complete
MTITKTWKLPKPIETEDGYEWTPVVRIGRTIPFGYKQDEEDRDILIPIPNELELLEQAKKYLKQYSYREVAAWLSEASDKYLSHVGLYKRVKLEQKRKTEAANQRHYAQRYKEAAEKAEKLEAQRTGARTYI